MQLQQTIQTQFICCFALLAWFIIWLFAILYCNGLLLVGISSWLAVIGHV
ncbi:hypothetical protein BDR07DRAFT_1412774 [Suillus spraguei]|nr:hypothetical protein BDR07DRAFT_1412774 [Suillus spraguei]